MRQLALLFCLITTSFAYSQKEANIWHFGQKIAFDFNAGSPTQIFGSEMDTFEGSTSFCDENGEILFYTNGGGRLPGFGQSGGAIWNRNNEVMYDMGGREGGGFSAAQSSIIIPKPFSEDQYFLFTMEEFEFDQDGDIPGQDGGRGLSYFEIDMSLNGGLGGVSVSDVRVAVPSYEGLNVVRHSNEEDFWIIINSAPNDRCLVFPVTQEGTGIPFDLAPTPSGGPIKSSPDGRIIATFGGATSLISFNPANGNSSVLSTLGQFSVFGEFAPNSRFFYTIEGFLSSTLTIIQYDLSAPNINQSRKVIWDAAVEGINDFTFTQCQLGPDGNIYFLTTNFIEQNLSVLRCPNNEDPTFNFNAIPIIEQVANPIYVGLPNFPAYIFALEELEVAFEVDSIAACNDQTVMLDPITNGSEFLWSTGETTPGIEVEESGNYIVTVTRGCEEVTDSVYVFILNENPISIESTNGLCEGASATLRVIGANITSYDWSTGSTDSTLTIDQPGSYSVTVTDVCGNVSSSSIDIESQSLPIVSFETSADIICEGETIEIIANLQFEEQISWSTGATTPQISISDPILYSVTVSNGCGETIQSIDLSDSGAVPPVIAIQASSSILCPNSSVSLEVLSDETDIFWSSGQTSNRITVNTPGLYSVEVTNECGTTIDSIAIASISSPPTPNILGPNFICDGIPILLEGEAIGATAFQWSTNESSSEIFADAPGTYSLTVTDVCGQTGTSAITLTPAQVPSVFLSSEGELSCPGDEITLEAQTNFANQVIWSTGDTSATTRIQAPGTYEFIAINDCGETRSNITINQENLAVYVPNAFSPNDDGINDLFQPFLKCTEISNYQFLVFSRWGELIFESETFEGGWDGAVAGEKADTGIYTWLLTISNSQQEVQLSGDVMLVR